MSSYQRRELCLHRCLHGRNFLSYLHGARQEFLWNERDSSEISTAVVLFCRTGGALTDVLSFDFFFFAAFLGCLHFCVFPRRTMCTVSPQNRSAAEIYSIYNEWSRTKALSGNSWIKEICLLCHLWINRHSILLFHTAYVTCYVTTVIFSIVSQHFAIFLSSDFLWRLLY